MWVTVTGHAACTYKKILSNDYILQSMSVSLYNIGLYLALFKLIAIILLYFFYFFGNSENFNKIFAARKQAMLQLYNVAMINIVHYFLFFFILREYARDFLKMRE